MVHCTSLPIFILEQGQTVMTADELRLSDDVKWENAETISGPKPDAVALRQVQRKQTREPQQKLGDPRQLNKSQRQMLQMQAETDKVKRQQDMHERMRGAQKDRKPSQVDAIRVNEYVVFIIIPVV